MQVVQFEQSPRLDHDGELWISVGKHCFATDWKNQQMMWSRLIKKISVPRRTPETYEEYVNMTRDEQNRIKDVGGFVGGTLKNGHRSGKTVTGRTILSYDIDFATGTFYEDLKLTADYASACYSTHKHSPSTPRYRLLIPLARQVTAEEYEAVARMVAKDIGMDCFDPTTFQPSRLMYWPSVAEDGEFFFDYMDAPFMDPDVVLGQYPDWKDVSLWPTHPKEKTARRRQAEKQADPTAKKGVVGTFCRTYDVPAAINKFLPDVYTPTAKSDRYTYAEGSTAAGLVVYEDGKFAFSNHSTDPASGQLCNAFDLVRIHKFGAEDENARPDTPVNKLPSYKAMLEFASSDKEVIRTYDAERSEELRQEFDNDDDDSDDWKTSKLKRNKDLILYKTVKNCETIFKYDRAFRGIALNLLSNRIDVLPENPVPWERREGSWTDTDDAQLFTYVGKTYIEFPRAWINDQKLIVAESHAFHPIKQYLEALPVWDGTPRLDTLFIDYLGAEDTIYTREVTAKMLTAAVMRIYEPGCKFDPMLVLSGPPGIGKSSIISWLAGEWFSDNLTFNDMSDKTAAESIQGYWILEISEMKGMKKMDVESVKAFVSRRVDIYRAAYAKNTEEHPRQCIIFGTVNDISGYLKDVTGNRRFWPVDVTGRGKSSVWDLTKEDRDQIWSEVMFRYKELGERKLTLSPEAEQIAAEKQTDALEADDREGIVEEYLNILLPENWTEMSLDARREYLDDKEAQLDGFVERNQVTVSEIWCECFGNQIKQLRKQDSYDISGILKRLGWVSTGKRKRVPLYGMQRTFGHVEDKSAETPES